MSRTGDHTQPPHPGDRQIAQTVHALNRGSRAYRLIVEREPRRQLDAFRGPYFYHAIITNIPDRSARAISRWHRKRADQENLIKEAKSGFAMAHLPCGTLTANAAYFQIAVLAYNVVQAWKLLTLPTSWHRYTIKTLRFRLLRIAGLVVYHSRQLVLKLPHDHPFFHIFCESRLRTIGLAAH